MLKSMPSPRGTNHARLFVVDRSPRGAYDAASDPDSAMLDLLEFLRDKLSEQDLATFCKMAGIEQAVTMDEPVPFNGMPQPGGKLYGQDERPGPAGLSGKTLAHIHSIKVSSATGY